jgi:hypothetical protein
VLVKFTRIPILTQEIQKDQSLRPKSERSLRCRVVQKVHSFRVLKKSRSLYYFTPRSRLLGGSLLLLVNFLLEYAEPGSGQHGPLLVTQLPVHLVAHLGPAKVGRD